MDMRVVGCMSGTSYDAIDTVAVDLSLDNNTLTGRLVGHASEPIPESLRADISAALPPQTTTAEAVCQLDTRLGQQFGRAIAGCVRDVAGGTADLAVCHGQTVYHWVDGGRALGTLQLGTPAEIAQICGLPVVSDLRSRDIAAGGHGAPLVSMLDALLILADRPRAGALNLGGIANITVSSQATAGGVLAYDLGPANALIDAAVVQASTGAATYDHDGAAAARGHVVPELLDRLLAHPYYAAPPPKSTGKELFHRGYLAEVTADLDVSSDDLVATVTELTAAVVARACDEHGLDEVVVSGGGTHNPTLMSRIRDRCAPTRITPIDVLFVPSQAKEAFAFALLGYLTVHGLPGTLPGATGAPRGSILGSITPGPNGWHLPPSGASAPTRMVLHSGPVDDEGATSPGQSSGAD